MRRTLLLRRVRLILYRRVSLNTKDRLLCRRDDENARADNDTINSNPELSDNTTLTAHR